MENDAVERALQLTRSSLSPAASDRQRVRSALPFPAHAALPVLPVLPVLPAGVPLPRSVALAGGRAQTGWSAALRLAAVAGLVAAGFSAGYVSGQGEAEQPPPLPPRARAVMEPVLLPEPAQVITAPEKSPEARVPRPAEPRQRAQPHRQRDHGEIELLRRSERAIRAGSGQLALALVEELEQRYPATHLAEERQAIRVLALCLREEPLADEPARQRAAAFLQRQPASVYAQRIREACEIESGK